MRGVTARNGQIAEIGPAGRRTGTDLRAAFVRITPDDRFDKTPWRC